MFDIHITPSLQKDFCISGKTKAFILVKDIYEISGIYSGLSIAVRRQLQGGKIDKTWLRIIRSEDSPNWFSVVRVFQGKLGLFKQKRIFRKTLFSVPTYYRFD